MVRDHGELDKINHFNLNEVIGKDTRLVIHLSIHFGRSVKSLKACNFASGWKILHGRPNTCKYIPNEIQQFHASSIWHDACPRIDGLP